jgi:hypothetical protein
MTHNSLSKALLAGLALAALAVGCQQPAHDHDVAQAAAPAQVDPVERGKYLVTIMGCHDCHTPKIMGEKAPELDETRLLAGHTAGGELPPAPAAAGPWIASASWDLTAWSGPWGISYSINLTPDTTGLAAWDAEIFVNAMRSGRHMGQGRPILPPMPWEMYGQATDEDLRSIFAYLQSIPPVENLVPPPVPPGGHPPDPLAPTGG